VILASSEESIVLPTAAPPLADRIAACGLSRLKLRWLKRTLAIAADPFSHEPVLACHGLRLLGCLASNLETHVECVPRPRQWGGFRATKPAKMPLFYSGADTVPRYTAITVRRAVLPAEPPGIDGRRGAANRRRSRQGAVLKPSASGVSNFWTPRSHPRSPLSSSPPRGAVGP
jgi:hypothetical protein